MGRRSHQTCLCLIRPPHQDLRVFWKDKRSSGQTEDYRKWTLVEVNVYESCHRFNQFHKLKSALFCNISVFSGCAAGPSACCVCQRVSGSRQPCAQCERSACPACIQQCSSCSGHCCNLCAVTEWVNETRMCSSDVCRARQHLNSSFFVQLQRAVRPCPVCQLFILIANLSEHDGWCSDDENNARRDFNEFQVKCKWDYYFIYCCNLCALYTCVYIPVIDEINTCYFLNMLLMLFLISSLNLFQFRSRKGPVCLLIMFSSVYWN